MCSRRREQPRPASAICPKTRRSIPNSLCKAICKLMADLRGIPPAEQKERLSAAIYATGLQDRLTQPIGQLSKGFRQRVGLAQAILHQPRLLILDEPSVGLDPTQIVEMRHLIRRLARQSTVLFSTHILPEVEALCDRVLILINGEVRADARLADLRCQQRRRSWCWKRRSRKRLPSCAVLPGVRKVEAIASDYGHPAYRIFGEEEADLCPAVYTLAASAAVARPRAARRPPDAGDWCSQSWRRDRSDEWRIARRQSPLATRTMQHATESEEPMKPIWSITRKELGAYFGSPAALIFLGIFLVVTLFTFFWVAASLPAAWRIFARSSSGCPCLLIFLVAALTMRQWSEEQRTGTVEMLMTLPVTRWQLVLGKFLAVMLLVAIGPGPDAAHAASWSAAWPAGLGPGDRRLPGCPADGRSVHGHRPLHVGAHRQPDRGAAADRRGGRAGLPGRRAGHGQSGGEAVGRGCCAASARAAALPPSSGACSTCAIWSTTSRWPLFFLYATVFTLDRKRWSHGERTAAYRRNSIVSLGAGGRQLLVLNLWLAPLWNLRVDATAQQEYTLSQTTKDLLASLQEPLLIRAYISEQTHPLLDPLRPQVEDLAARICHRRQRQGDRRGGGPGPESGAGGRGKPDLWHPAHALSGGRSLPGRRDQCLFRYPGALRRPGHGAQLPRPDPGGAATRRRHRCAPAQPGI